MQYLCVKVRDARSASEQWGPAEDQRPAEQWAEEDEGADDRDGQREAEHGRDNERDGGVTYMHINR